MAKRRPAPLAVLALSAAIGAGQLAGAAVRCVPVDHPGACDSLHATIQAAVDAAVDGDTVLVAPGIYPEQVAVIGKAVTLRGARAGEAAPHRTGPESSIVHAAGPLVVCGEGIVIDGFSLSGATDIDGAWAGAWIDGSRCGAGALRLENNIVRDNIVGIQINGFPATLRNNWVRNNTAIPAYSTGISAATMDATIEDNLIEGHLASSMSFQMSQRVVLARNRFDRGIDFVRCANVSIRDNVALAPDAGTVLIHLVGDDHAVLIEGNLLQAPGARAVVVSDSSGFGPNTDVAIHLNCLVGAGATGLEVQAGAHAGPLPADRNWWGDASGPSGAGPGTGSALIDPSGAVAFAPFNAAAPSCGCTEMPDGTPCDDGNSCTAADACAAGVCQGGGPTDCDDDNACTLDGCANQACTHLPIVCTDDGNQCTDEICEPATGCASVVDPSNTCEISVCTNDVCVNGVCQSTPAYSCDDGNPCTDDSCNPNSGACVHVNDNANTCSSGQPCRYDHCVNGACVSQSCQSDTNPCTDTVCDTASGNCIHVNDNTNSCSDDNVCTDDACTSGTCVSVADDSNPCSDGNLCTANACVAGTCVANPIDCDDGQACSVDSCSPSFGCVHTPPPACNDGNPCTSDTCSDSAGCLYAPAPNGTACDNPTNCNHSEVCTNGVCGGGTFYCDIHHDSWCHRVTCDAGQCGVYNPPCGDGTECTDDSCDDYYGCTHSLRCVTHCEVVDVRFGADRRLRFSGPLLDCDDPDTVSGLEYRVLRGQIAELPVGSHPAQETCSWSYMDLDLAVPDSGEGFWFLVRAAHRQNANLGPAAYTFGYQGVHGVPAAERLTAASCP